MTIYERLKSFEYIELFEFMSYAFDIYIKPEKRDEFFEEFNNLSIDQMAQFVAYQFGNDCLLFCPLYEQCHESTKMIDSPEYYILKKSCKETIKDWLNTKLRFDGFFETASLFLNGRD